MSNLVKNALLLVSVVLSQTVKTQTMAEGMAAMQMEDWDKAIAVYTFITKANATEQQAWLALGNAYLAKGDKAQAKQSFNKAFEAKPDGPFALISNGRNFLLDNKTAEADEQFKKAENKGKKDVDALRAIGESYLYGSTRNLTRAEEKLKNAYNLKPKDFATLMALGYCYKEMPKGGDAILHYEFAEAISPNNTLALYMKARVYRQAKLPEKYLDQLALVIASDKGHTQSLREIAEYWYYTKRNYVKALPAYKDLIDNGREVLTDDWAQLANCYFLNKKFKECIEAVDIILKKDPTKNYLRRLQGYCLYETEQPEKSFDVLSEYFKNVPTDKVIASDYDYIARARLKTKGDTAVAVTELRKAIEIDKSMWANHKDIAGLYSAQRNYCAAKPEYLLYFDSVPKPEAMDYYRLGQSQYWCREIADSVRFKDALASFIKVTELSPTAAIGWLWSGKSAAKLDPDIANDPSQSAAYGKAEPYYSKYSEIAWADKEKNKKDLVPALYYNTYVYYLRGDAAKFHPTCSKLLELEPTHPLGTELMKVYNDNGGTLPPPASPGGSAPMPGGETPMKTPTKNGGGKH